MIVKIGKINIGIVCILWFFSSCIDETFTNTGDVEGTYISVRGIGLQKSTDYGSSEDYIIRNFRILAFDKATGECKSNKKYSAWEGDIIRHQIDVGNYDFVFLANEPANIPVINKLNAVSVYTDLNHIAYPARYFSSDQLIPMIQEIKDVTVLADGKGAKLSDNTEVAILQLALDRLAVRVEVLLEAEDDFDEVFEGVTFSNIPNWVPLTANYVADSEETKVKWEEIRKFTREDDGNYFSDGTPATGNAWAKKVSRIILPANELSSVDEKEKAVVFTVNMGKNYSPSCELKIAPEPTVNYSLPVNTMLDFHGIIKEPLEVNIKASEWDKTGNGWEISGNRMLNVSETEVWITDFNGARISFWSNMPVVRVLENVKVKSTGEIPLTNDVFNALSSQEWKPNGDERISYNPRTGSGYMDILLDLPNTVGEETYELTLMAAEDYEGTNALQRTIKVHVKQEGTRYPFYKNGPAHLWSTPYIGAFWKDDEVGERIISGIRWSYWWGWSVSVPPEYQDWIVLSTSPSFDPHVGTDNPGDPEDYPVVPNGLKGEDGTAVSGRGRIYFRIGLKSKNDTGKPKYGVVNLVYYEGDTPVNTQLFIRQGDEPDYLMRDGTSGMDYGSKFSVYNLTVKEFRRNPGTDLEAYKIDYSNLQDEVDFVEYPTQAGAHFRWGLPMKDAEEARYAYHPTNKNYTTQWEASYWPMKFMTEDKYWVGTDTEKGYEDEYEICPEGYYRPTDGPADRMAVNSNPSYGNQIYQSDWRMSIFRTPMRGDGYYTTSQMPFYPEYKTEFYNAAPLEEVMYGFYADGYFDRRPIQQRTMINGLERGTGTTSQYRGVSLDTTEAAYIGTLIFNPDTKASVFFPAAGRRWHSDGSLEFASETGYYWSSSVAPGWTDVSSGEEKGARYGNIWAVQLCYATPTPMSSGHQFGYSIRCVKKK